MVAFVFLSPLLFSAQAIAASDWYHCYISLAGLGGQGGTYLRLTDAGDSPQFMEKVFRVPDSHSKEMLAIALTAVSANLKVFVFVDPAEGTYPEIISFYIAP